MKVYLSGPMTGIENYNCDGFSNAEKEIWKRAKNVEVLNPWVLSGVVSAECARLGATPEYYDYLRYDIQKLMTADAVFLLDGWENSKGAVIENEIAQKVGIPSFAKMDELFAYIDSLRSLNE